MSKEIGKPDYVLLAVISILLMLGIVVLASVSSVVSQKKFGEPNFYLTRHILFGVLPAVVLGFAAYRVPLSFLKKYAPFFLIATLFLMVLVFFPKIGINSGGASRWINLGITSFQPSELLKITFILYLAAWLPLVAEKTKKDHAKVLIAFLGVLGIIIFLLVLQPNVSTMGIIAVTGILMYFLSGSPLRYNLMIVGAGLALLIVLILIEPYRLERFMVFLRPDIDPMRMSYQLKQALITVGSGGIFGKGLGMSGQKFGFLPEPMADSIFAVFAEETGLVGASIIVLLFLIFAWRGMEIARKTNDFFYKLIAFGITCWIMIQAFVNIGAMVGVMPLTGIPLPFISYGGSALLAGSVGVGILLNISRNI